LRTGIGIGTAFVVLPAEDHIDARHREASFRSTSMPLCESSTTIGRTLAARF